MSIAIQASDLDHGRIDGTRVYLAELLKRFGALAPEQDFKLYHQKPFNPLLAPPLFPNYQETRIPFPLAWMQTRFAWQLFEDQPQFLFLPIQAAPVWLPTGLNVAATIHDLAWKRYPETFPLKDRLKLDFLLDQVVTRADKLIAVSRSTHEDLLRYFPNLASKRIQVIHHGFDADFFGERVTADIRDVTLSSFRLSAGEYILYVGALQPRKNLVRLIEAFEYLKAKHPEAKLVLVGEKAWLWQPIVQAAEQSRFAKDILFLGQKDFLTTRILYQGARFFAFPSLYEGFGLPLLEALASGSPVLASENSSLPEVAGAGALYCNAQATQDIAAKMEWLWQDQKLREKLVGEGALVLQNFSWERCAKQTLEYILEH